MQDPVIIVTGAGKGIGRAVVLELIARSHSEKGYKPRFLLVSRSPNDLKTLGGECQRAGLKAEYLAVDVAEASSSPAIVKKCMDTFGRIDCLVNNAGVGRFGDFLELKAQDLDYVFKTNLNGTFLITQEVFKQMHLQQSGHIVFVTSVAAKKPFEQSAIYCMSKYGQQGLVDVLRLYGYKSGVRVTNVLPGATLTPMWGEVDEKMKFKMMPVESVARSIVDAIRLPAPANLDEIVIRPMTGDL